MYVYKLIKCFYKIQGVITSILRTFGEKYKKQNIMKKIVLITFLLLSSLTQAQNFSEGDSAINFGLGIGGYYATGTGYSTTIPPLEIQYEKFIKDNISVGGFLGYQSASYKYTYWDETYKWTYSYTFIGGFGNYHFYDQDKLEAYAGVRLGYLIFNETASSSVSGLDYSASDGSGLVFGAHAGGRYFFNEKFAVNAEVGYGISLLKVGITYKL